MKAISRTKKSWNESVSPRHGRYNGFKIMNPGLPVYPCLQMQAMQLSVRLAPYVWIWSIFGHGEEFEGLSASPEKSGRWLSLRITPLSEFRWLGYGAMSHRQGERCVLCCFTSLHVLSLSLRESGSCQKEHLSLTFVLVRARRKKKARPVAAFLFSWRPEGDATVDVPLATVCGGGSLARRLSERHHHWQRALWDIRALSSQL